jgi:hypothetical protein
MTAMQRTGDRTIRRLGLLLAVSGKELLAHRLLTGETPPLIAALLPRTPLAAIVLLLPETLRVAIVLRLSRTPLAAIALMLVKEEGASGVAEAVVEAEEAVVEAVEAVVEAVEEVEAVVEAVEAVMEVALFVDVTGREPWRSAKSGASRKRSSFSSHGPHSGERSTRSRENSNRSGRDFASKQRESKLCKRLPKPTSWVFTRTATSVRSTPSA